MRMRCVFVVFVMWGLIVMLATICPAQTGQQEWTLLSTTNTPLAPLVTDGSNGCTPTSPCEQQLEYDFDTASGAIAFLPWYGVGSLTSVTDAVASFDGGVASISYVCPSGGVFTLTIVEEDGEKEVFTATSSGTCLSPQQLVGQSGTPIAGLTFNLTTDPNPSGNYVGSFSGGSNSSISIQVNVDFSVQGTATMAGPGPGNPGTFAYCSGFSEGASTAANGPDQGSTMPWCNNGNFAGVTSDVRGAVQGCGAFVGQMQDGSNYYFCAVTLPTSGTPASLCSAQTSSMSFTTSDSQALNSTGFGVGGYQAGVYTGLALGDGLGDVVWLVGTNTDANGNTLPPGDLYFTGFVPEGVCQGSSFVDRPFHRVGKKLKNHHRPFTLRGGMRDHMRNHQR